MMYLCRNRFFVLIIVFCTALFYIVGLFLNENVEHKHVKYNPVLFSGEHRCPTARITKDVHHQKGIRKKQILFYTNIFDGIPVFYPGRLKCCEPFECEITLDKSKILQSDAVVFHGRDLPKADKMPTHLRTAKQRWIFYTMENPYHSKIVAKDYNEMFNWTMTYERRADIYEPYGIYAKKTDGKEFTPKNHASEKDKFAVFVNSHCSTAQRVRENYVRAINRLRKVDIYGECGGIFGRIMCPRYGEKCAKRLGHYKFYLAFENAICQDYVTEKYWDSVPIGTIPVVFGGKTFKDLAIAGSYIDVSKFSNVESLVKYLEYLDRNDTAYNEYFAWEKFYQKSYLEPWPCRLCRMLHDDSLPEQTYRDFQKYLDPIPACRVNLKHFQIYTH